MAITATITTTISKQCHNMSNECNTDYYSYPDKYNMDIPLHSYMYTLFLGIGCYSLLNPTFMRRMMVNVGFSFANMLLGGFIIYNEHIYKPFNKYIYKPLVYILNIQEKEDEIMIIKDGVVIHSFKTMDDFIKQQPINFICDDEDEDEDEDDEGGSEEENSNQETNDKGEGDENKSSNNESDGKIVDTIIDADLTQLSTDIHESEPGEGDGEGENESGDESEKEEEEDDEDDFILDPSEYDFLLRNVYYESEKESERFCVSLKYETFCKSDTKKVFTNEELKTQLSKRKLIAINLHMNSKKYSINLTTPVNYFTVENSILGYHFLKWYMAQTYDVILDNKYTVLCIDNFVGMYKIKPGKKLVIYSDSLKVVDDDEYSVEDADDNDDEEHVESNNHDEEDEEDEEDEDDEQDEQGEQAKKSDQLNDACDVEVVDCE
jgi:hypothetical protein